MREKLFTHKHKSSSKIKENLIDDFNIQSIILNCKDEELKSILKEVELRNNINMLITHGKFKGMTPLVAAVKNKDKELVVKLISLGANDLNSRISALEMAIMNKDKELIELFLNDESFLKIDKNILKYDEIQQIILEKYISKAKSIPNLIEKIINIYKKGLHLKTSRGKVYSLKGIISLIILIDKEIDVLKCLNKITNNYNLRDIVIYLEEKKRVKLGNVPFRIDTYMYNKNTDVVIKKRNNFIFSFLIHSSNNTNSINLFKQTIEQLNFSDKELSDEVGIVKKIKEQLFKNTYMLKEEIKKNITLKGVLTYYTNGLYKALFIWVGKGGFGYKLNNHLNLFYKGITDNNIVDMSDDLISWWNKPIQNLNYDDINEKGGLKFISISSKQPIESLLLSNDLVNLFNKDLNNEINKSFDNMYYLIDVIKKFKLGGFVFIRRR